MHKLLKSRHVVKRHLLPVFGHAHSVAKMCIGGSLREGGGGGAKAPLEQGSKGWCPSPVFGTVKV